MLEYASTQLLEFRYYDDLLTRVLADVTGDWSTAGGYWVAGRPAVRLND